MSRKKGVALVDIGRLSSLMKQGRADMSMREYLEGCTVGTAVWCRVENGTEPSLQNFVAICDWLDVDPGSMIRQMRIHR